MKPIKREHLCTLLLVLWLLTFSHLVRAATLNEFMGAYDWLSLAWAAAIALMGGALRTIVSLAAADIVRSLWMRWLKDSIVSLIAGMAAYVAIEACRSMGFPVPAELRFALIVGAGVARMSTFPLIADLGRDWLAARKASLVRAEAELQKEPPRAAPPASESKP